jgi:hypothetical protein
MNQSESIIVTKTNLNGELELVMLNKKAEQIYNGL